MVIRGSYLLTVFISILIVVAGHRYAVDGVFAFQEDSMEVVRARVQEIGQRIQPIDEYGDIIPMLGERLGFQARITHGQRSGTVVYAMQNLTGFSGISAREVRTGNSILLINIHDEWHYYSHVRTNRLLGLGLFFIICVLIFGRTKGFNTLLSLGLTCAVVFAVFIPSILSGKNIYFMSLFVCAYSIAMTLLIVIGINKKSLAAAIGCAGGVAITGIISLIMDRVLLLTGIVDEHSRYLASLPLENQINLRAIIFAGIIIGAMGAIMDVSISISSSLWEIKEKSHSSRLNFKSLFKSGITIGRDIIGTMANTLVLAYIGSSLSLVLLISVYSSSLVSLFNSEMVVVEILQALSGILGILLAMPLTALVCAFIYLRKEKNKIN